MSYQSKGIFSERIWELILAFVIKDFINKTSKGAFQCSEFDTKTKRNYFWVTRFTLKGYINTINNDVWIKIITKQPLYSGLVIIELKEKTLTGWMKVTSSKTLIIACVPVKVVVGMRKKQHLQEVSV